MEKCKETTAEVAPGWQDVHHPDRLAAALAAMLANNNRITPQSRLSRCKRWQWRTLRQRHCQLCRTPSRLDLVCPSPPHSNAPLCPGRHFLSLSSTTAASLLLSSVRPYLPLTVLILPLCVILHPHFLGFCHHRCCFFGYCIYCIDLLISFQPGWWWWWDSRGAHVGLLVHCFDGYIYWAQRINPLDSYDPRPFPLAPAWV